MNTPETILELLKSNPDNYVSTMDGLIYWHNGKWVVLGEFDDFPIYHGEAERDAIKALVNATGAIGKLEKK